MGFIKLDRGILNSSVWVDRDVRDVFVTALLMARVHELREDTPQLDARTMEPTGWEIPTGWYGFVEAAGVGIIRNAGVDRETGIAALERMGAPERESLASAFEGRRMVRINGGYIILNFMRYLEKDHGSAERQRRYRERKRLREAVARQPSGFTEEEIRLGRMAIRERADEP